MKCLAEDCENEFENKTGRRRFCSDACKMKWHRKHPKKNTATKMDIQVLLNEFKAAIQEMGSQQPTIKYRIPDEKAYDGAKLSANYVDDEPLSFDKLRQQIVVPASTNDFFGEMNRAESLEELEAIGRKIKTSGMTWKEQQRYTDYGKQMAKKFL